MKTILISLLIVCSLKSQTINLAQNVLLSPYGTWEICYINAAYWGPQLCPNGTTVLTGTEPYVLQVPAMHSRTVAFAYSLVIQQNGVQKVFTGIFKRNDDLAKGLVDSSTIIYCGIVDSATVTIAELQDTLGEYSKGVSVLK